MDIDEQIGKLRIEIHDLKNEKEKIRVLKELKKEKKKLQNENNMINKLIISIKNIGVKKK